jgi:hypothetical protein
MVRQSDAERGFSVFAGVFPLPEVKTTLDDFFTSIFLTTSCKTVTDLCKIAFLRQSVQIREFNQIGWTSSAPAGTVQRPTDKSGRPQMKDGCQRGQPSGGWLGLSDPRLRLCALEYCRSAAELPARMLTFHRSRVSYRCRTRTAAFFVWPPLSLAPILSKLPFEGGSAFWKNPETQVSQLQSDQPIFSVRKGSLGFLLIEK